MAIVMETLSGRDDKDMTSSREPVPQYLNHLTDDISHLKIAVLKNVVDELNDSRMKDNFDTVIQTLKELGAIVEDVTMPVDLLKAVLPTYIIIANSEATSNHACLDGIKYGHQLPGKTAEEVVIHSRTDGFSSQIKRRFILGNLALATNNQEKMFRKAQKVRRLIVEQLNNIYQNYDIILTPNCGGIAPRVDEVINNQSQNDNSIIENHLILANFAGTPSLSLPCGFIDNMPIAINLTGRLFEEQTVLNVAYALENQLGYKNQFSKKG
jgi:aspartyl-tRNA(Asn)/glutamyl-tRNA(Gln) amidotransferase subunit A